MKLNKKSSMIKRSLSLMLCLAIVLGTLSSMGTMAAPAERNFKVITRVEEYGTVVPAVIIDMGETVAAASVAASDYTVTCYGMSFTGQVNATPTTRNITKAYVSDKMEIDPSGVGAASGRYIVLELQYGYNDVNGCYALQYVFSTQFNVQKPLERYAVVKSGSSDTITNAGTVNLLVDEFAKKTTADDLNYRLYTPNMESGKKYPLVIWIHGFGEGGTDNAAQLMGNKGGVAWIEGDRQEKNPCFVAAPQCKTSTSWARTDASKIHGMIDEILASNPEVDTNRIYVTGCSMGGFMTWNTILYNPSRFAAAMPICAATQLANPAYTDEEFASLKSLPMWLFQSADDTTVRPAANSDLVYQKLIDNGKAVDDGFKYTKFPSVQYNGHWSWVPVLNDSYNSEKIGVVDWLFAQKKADAVKVTGGYISGVPADQAGVTLYKGVPFAKPPVGDLRWKAPQDLDENTWSGVRVCDTWGNQQFQNPDLNPPGGFWGDEFYYEGSPKPEASEDGLYLNVYTPSTGAANEKYPVLVWIHGGGFDHGFASEVEFNAAKLAAKGIIVVQIQYRVGALGFLALPGLSAENDRGVSGNYGLLDQIKSLEWVQKNIAAFGGDPANVTICGQSAGGMSVNALLSTPLTKGLFNRAILQSGFSGYVAANSYPTLEAKTAACVTAVQAAFGTTDVNELRKLPAADILAKGALGSGNMTKDGYVFTDESVNRRRDGALDGIDIMIGGTSDEMTSLMGNQNGTTNVTTFQNSMKSKFAPYGYTEDIYDAQTEKDAYRMNLRASCDSSLAQYRLSAMYSNAHNQDHTAYAYYFEQKLPPHTPQYARDRDEDFYGAFHSSELWYMFNSMRDVPQQRQWTEKDYQLGDTMTSYWANFVKTGNPNGEGLPVWQQCDSTTDAAFMSFRYGEAVPGGSEFPKRDVINLAYAKAVTLKLSDEEIVMPGTAPSVTSLASKIVAGYAANLPVQVTFPAEAYAARLGLFAPDGTLVDSLSISASGRYVFTLKAGESVAGNYLIKASTSVMALSQAAVECVPAPADLWSPVATSGEGSTVVVFASDVSFNAVKKAVKIGDTAIDVAKVSASGKTVTIAAAAASGQKIVIGGVKYADLFPSYSFSFTVTVK